MRRLLGAILLLLLTPGCVIVETGVRNPMPEVSTVAVAPFFNLSGEPSQVVDGRRFARAYYAELQQVPGYEVVPVGVTELALVKNDLDLNDREDVLELARILGVDAVVVGAVTLYDPYYPPRLGMRVEWLAPEAQEFSPGIPVDPRARRQLLERLDEQEEKHDDHHGHRLPIEMPGSAHPGGHPIIIRGQTGSLERGALSPATTGGRTVEGRSDAPRPVNNEWTPSPERPTSPGKPDRGVQSASFPGPSGKPVRKAGAVAPRRLSIPAARSVPASQSIPPAGGGERIRRSTLSPALPSVARPDPSQAPSGEATAQPGKRPGGYAFPAQREADEPSDSSPRPVMSYSRVFDGTDEELLATLRDYVELNGDLRSGGWQAYLHRSEDFIRFCAHRMIVEMLTLHGGEGRRRIVLKWRKFK